MQQYQYHEVNELGLGNSRQQGEVHCHWEVSREVDVACARLPASVALQEKSVTATSLSAGQANSSKAGGTHVRQMFMEVASVSFVWKMTYKWRHVTRHDPLSLLLQPPLLLQQALLSQNS